MGREFELSSLCAVDGRSAPAVIDDLQHAAHAGIVEQSGLARWTFCHSLYRERLYDDLPAETRVEIHHRVAEDLEERNGTDAVPVAELAHHFFRSARADRGAKAVRYCALAGEAAMASLAFEEAAVFYARALEALALAENVDGQRRYDLSVSLGEARFRAGDLPGAREAYGMALAVARALGAPELLARAALGSPGCTSRPSSPTRRPPGCWRRRCSPFGTVTARFAPGSWWHWPVASWRSVPLGK